MKNFRVELAVAVLAVAVLAAAASGSSAHAADVPTPKPAAVAEPSAVHDFDFQVGDWRVHHRVKRATDGGHWTEFEGTCSNHRLMGGFANVEDHVFKRPTGATRAVGLRAYDPKTAQWAIWWVDGRDPLAAVDPPVKGHFDKGVGTFYADGLIDGKTIRTRYQWSNITPTSAHWEQAFSADAGKTWDTNWLMDFVRVGDGEHKGT